VKSKIQNTINIKHSSSSGRVEEWIQRKGERKENLLTTYVPVVD
jgi:hypothetical protein